MAKLQDLRAMAKVVPDEYNLWAVPASMRSWMGRMVHIRQDDDIWKGVTSHDYLLCTKTEDGALVVVFELVVEPQGLCVYQYGKVLWENIKAIKGRKG